MNCPICKAKIDESENIVGFFGGDQGERKEPKYFVLPCKDLKGHKKRYMFCTEKHMPHGTQDYEKILDAVKMGLALFHEDFIVLNGVNASIKEHWHVIICDRRFDGEKVDVTKEPRIEVFRS